MTHTPLKLPLGSLLKESYAFFFKNFRLFFKVSLFWCVALSLLTFPMTYMYFFHPSFASTEEGIFLQEIFFTSGLLFCLFCMGPMLSVFFMKASISGKKMSAPWLYFSFGRKEGTYILYMLSLLFLWGTGILILTLLLNVFGLLLELFFPFLSHVLQSYYDGNFISLAALTFSLPWAFRAFLIFPAVSYGDARGFLKTLKASWLSTQENSFSLLLLLLLGGLLPFFSFIYFNRVLFNMLSFLIEDSAVVFSGTSEMFIFIGNFILILLFYGLLSCTLGKIYHFKRKKMLSVFKELRS